MGAGLLGGGAAGGPVGVVIGIVGTIIQYLLGAGTSIKQFAHDITVSIKVAWDAIAGPIRGVITLIKDGILGLIKRLKQLIDDLRKKLGSVIGPLIIHAKQVRAFIDIIFNQYVAPILQTIQHIRQTLEIFKLFHLKWAEALDKRLAALEGEIASRFLIVKQYLNKYLDFLELIMDPTGVLNPLAVWGATVRSINGLGALIRGFGFRPLLPFELNKRSNFARATDQTSLQDKLTRYSAGNLATNDQSWDAKALSIMK